MTLRLYNTLTRKKEEFTPLDPQNVRMYVCGPTVYDFAHIGNARPVIVFDVLFRLLRHLYGESHVTYVRNITDVDDKINARALRDFGKEIDAGDVTLNEAIRRVTEKTANQFHADVAALGCLPPTHEPRATDHIPGMVGMIGVLIKKGHAYQAAGEVLFDVASMKDYGQLSHRKLEEQQAGARVAVDAHKKNPGDFVLWKLSSAEEPGWESPWGRGRPGWHIECSEMSRKYLGEVFDIHGGGLDLIFPHHENEIAQSRCAFGTDVMANIWMHNGFLQVEGQKMSKSLGNFFTISELLETEKFGGRKWPGEVLRIAMLMTHYREPIDFSLVRLQEAERTYLRWAKFIAENIDPLDNQRLFSKSEKTYSDVSETLLNDLNTPLAIARLNSLVREGKGELVLDQFQFSIEQLGFSLSGLYLSEAIQDFLDRSHEQTLELDNLVQTVIDQIGKEKFRGDINSHLADLARRIPDEQIFAQISIRLKIAQRSLFISERSWKEADRIRDELLAKGINLKDVKDSITGERRTEWSWKK
jgi:cysteinyl-tRNA synthetase